MVIGTTSQSATATNTRGLAARCDSNKQTNKLFF